MKGKVTLFTLLMAGFGFAQIQFPQVSSKSEIEQTIGYTKVEVDYFRPNLNQRTAFGGIVPFGQVWRTGANNNTVIQFDTDVLIEGKPLVKGEYSIYTLPSDASWEVYFYKKTDNWGNPKDWNKDLIALTVKVPVQKISEKVESFTIGFDEVTVNNAKMYLAWENTKVALKIDVPTQQIAMQNIQTQLNDQSSARDFYGAANYYYSNQLDLKKAQEWINKAIAKDPKAPQHFIDLKTKIDQDLKKK